MASSNELQTILDEVSQNCLDGQPVPADLAALWAAQLRDDTDLMDAYEMTLFEGADDDILEGFRVEDGVEPAAAAAYERMANQIRWIADVFDGSLIGYWVGDEPRAIADSPIVIVDPDGQFDLGGRTLTDFLLEQTDTLRSQRLRRRPQRARGAWRCGAREGPRRDLVAYGRLRRAQRTRDGLSPRRADACR